MLASVGMTVSDLMRIVLTRTANEKALPLDILAGDEAYDAWFRAKVKEAIEDVRPPISNEEMKRRMDQHKAKTRRRG